MTRFIPDEIIDAVLEKTDIVEIISSRVPLKKTGRNFKANCPFHNEKTPSFVVNQDKQIFHCFGCGQGGNALGFLMKYDKMSFREAIKILADKAGIKLPDFFEERDDESQGIAGKFYKINESARDYYMLTLNEKESEYARRYLKERGLSDDSIRLFGIGLAPDMWEGLLSHFKKSNTEPDTLLKAGLILPSEKKQGYYDRFRNRVIFPIFDIRDKIVGFGARSLGTALPKYINSPETVIYTKGSHLYGLNFSKGFIREKEYAVIVEGYLDFILPFQHGIKNIVATLGTALTPSQVKLLKRFTRTIVMVYDPDKAGEEASLRGMDLLISLDMNVRVSTLPKDYDPDSYVRKYGAAEFEKIIKSSKDLFDYKIGLLKTRFNKDGARGKTAIAALMLPTINLIPNEILKDAFLKKLSNELSIDEGAIRAELKKTKPEYRFMAAEAKSVNIQKKQTRHAERLLLSLVLTDPAHMEIVKEKLGIGSFRDKDVKSILEVVDDFYRNKMEISASRIINRVDDNGAKNLISEAASIYETIHNKEKSLIDCLKRVREDNFREDLDRIKSEIRAAQDLKDTLKVDSLLAQYNELIKSHKR